MATTHRSPAAETARAVDPAQPLAPDARHLHRTLINAVIATGSVPSVVELADRLGTTQEAIRAGLTTLVSGDYLALDATGQVSCLYPFSTTSTAHAVIIEGQRRFAMCAIDALGIPAMLDEELDIDGRCVVCHAPITLRVRPGTIVMAAPPTAMVVARRDETEPAFAACCPFTVFVCGQEHADEFMRRIAGTHALPLPEALVHAEQIFNSLFTEAIPATRPRGKRWGSSRDA
ncbi:MAG: alkylmercury lyase family protein [Chloroflexia bacterium]|nr:alkylmercury lyase family protein [Chloroflexia bacterium]